MLRAYVGLDLSEAIRDLADAEVHLLEVQQEIRAARNAEDARRVRFLNWRLTGRRTDAAQLRLTVCRVAEANYYLRGRGHTHPLVVFGYQAGD